AAAQVRHGIGNRGTDAGDDLHRVQQQLLTDRRMLGTIGRGDRVQYRLGHLTQVAGVAVDQRQLPLHPDGGTLRGLELDRHGTILPPHGAPAAPPRESSQLRSTTSTLCLPCNRVRMMVACSGPDSESCWRSYSGTTEV